MGVCQNRAVLWPELFCPTGRADERITDKRDYPHEYNLDPAELGNQQKETGQGTMQGNSKSYKEPF